jgi:hypothetical protein
VFGVNNAPFLYKFAIWDKTNYRLRKRIAVEEEYQIIVQILILVQLVRGLRRGMMSSNM